MSRTSRRKILKAIAAGSTLGVAPGVSAAPAPSQEKGMDPNEAKVPYPNVEYHTVGEDVWEVLGPQYWLLTTDRNRLDELVSFSSEDDKLTQTHAETIDEARNRYEIKEMRRGHELRYTLADQDPKAASEKLRSNLQSAAGAVLEGLAVEAEGDGASIAWSPGHDADEYDWEPGTTPDDLGHHSKMTEHALEDFDMYDFRKQDIYEMADVPDYFGCEDCSADWLPGIDNSVIISALEVAISQLEKAQHPPFHFHWSSPVSLEIGGWVIDPLGFGGAPGEAQHMMDQADSSQLSERRKYLAWAIHYVQDMAVPLHTGAIWSQLNPDPLGCSDGLSNCFDPRFSLHYGYENWAAAAFENEYDYMDNPLSESFNDPDPFDISSVEGACVALSHYSGQYSTEVFGQLVDEGVPDEPDEEVWEDVMYQISHNCMYYAGGYTRGLIDKYYDYII